MQLLDVFSYRPAEYFHQQEAHDGAIRIFVVGNRRHENRLASEVEMISGHLQFAYALELAPP